MLTIDAAVLLTIIIALRLRRRTEARSRADEKLTVVTVLVLGILIAPTDIGQSILRMTGQLVDGISQIKL